MLTGSFLSTLSFSFSRAIDSVFEILSSRVGICFHSPARYFPAPHVLVIDLRQCRATVAHVVWRQ